MAMAAAAAAPPPLHPITTPGPVRPADLFSRRDRTADLILLVDATLYYVHRHLLGQHSRRIAGLDAARSRWTIRLPVVPDLVAHSGPCLAQPLFALYLGYLYGYDRRLRDDQCARCVLALLMVADFMGSGQLRAHCEYLVGQNYPLSEASWRPLLHWCKKAALSVRIPIAVYTFLYDRYAYACQLRKLFALDPDDFCGVLLLPTASLSALERVRLLAQYVSGQYDDLGNGMISLRSSLMSPEKFCSMVTAMFAANGAKDELERVRELVARLQFNLGHAALDQHWRNLLDKMLLSSAVRALIRTCALYRHT